MKNMLGGGYDILKDHPYYYVQDSSFINEKVYFPKDMDRDSVDRLYYSLITEQDPESPHCYFDDAHNPKGYVFLDIGTAEGLVSLQQLEAVDHAYLFEGDLRWAEPLELTFKNHHDKITLIKKYVSDIDEGEFISLNSFIKENDLVDKPLFIKLDVEGMEMQILQCVAEAICKPGTRLSVCTYHKSEDSVVIKEYLDSLGFKTRFTPGYMFVNLNSDKYEFRKGVLYAEYEG